MAKILVTGANGQLGSEFRDLENSFPKHQFLFVTRSELNIADEAAVTNLFQEFQPDYCINCAAYTAVDKAETEEQQAFAINAYGVRHLAAASLQCNTKLIHISTDYVFDGTASIPYRETDVTNPMGIYGASKLKGEEEALAINKDIIILRTSWVYSVYGNNFVKTIMRLMESRPEISVVADQFGTPTYAADLAAAIMQIIESGNWQPGIYHYSNEGIISWFDFAMAIKKIINSSCTIHPITTEQYPTPAKRPKYSVLDKTKIKNTFQLQGKYWLESLEHCIQKLQQKG